MKKLLLLVFLIALDCSAAGNDELTILDFRHCDEIILSSYVPNDAASELSVIPNPLSNSQEIIFGQSARRLIKPNTSPICVASYLHEGIFLTSQIQQIACYGSPDRLLAGKVFAPYLSVSRPRLQVFTCIKGCTNNELVQIYDLGNEMGGQAPEWGKDHPLFQKKCGN